MAVKYQKKITLTEDMLKLISNIQYGEAPMLDEKDTRQSIMYGIDFNALYGGSTFEDVAIILGLYDKRIPGTEEEPLGAKFPKEIEDYMWNIHTNIVDHIEEIEQLVHWFSNKGGLKPGNYGFKGIWEYIGE